MSSAIHPLSSPEPGIEAKLRFLGQADAYPGCRSRPEVVETHMSWVFLTERWAYKLKKPVRYDYLDFSTPEARRRDCEEEVRLNRRLAPSVYLGTLALTRDAAGRLALEGEGEPVDWLVKMRRLPRRRMLDQLIRRREVGEADIRRLALTLARFHRACPRAALGGAEYLERLAGKARDDLGQLALPAFGLPADLVERVAAAQRDLLRTGREDFAERARAGRIVEGHGDLRPEHVCLEAEPLVIDCLEFARDFRILDTADELAFLAMECERLGAAWIGPVLFEAYNRERGDAATRRRPEWWISTRAIGPACGPRCASGT